ncbi:hypothetical protein CWR45_18340 [Oceanobacillus chungangensis]|uniref:Uncharacterized protein n=1 Tax=Oceanobacillus chungangensis TaxID=1229152 RepID=A0A3D8PI16_9BACI|nr:hypothetical protein CWR45_18340 [Oceanobacillus chungangensis]
MEILLVKVLVIEEAEIKLVIGTGEYHNNPGWLHTQEEELNLIDEDTKNKRFENNSIPAILAEHVREHLIYAEGIVFAKMCYKFLIPSGYLRCAVPDGFFQDDTYQNIVKIGGPAKLI